MTTDYTDDDVKAVQGTAICGPTQARRLLDAGYRKVAPEPEPEERWEVVEGCVLRDTVEARRWDLGSGAFAERVARLLNIDEAAKAGGFKGLRHRAVTAEAERDEARAEVERLADELDAAQLRSIEARNPGIDMDDVKRSRSAGDTTVRTDTEPLSLNERGLFTADLVGGLHVNMDGSPGPLAFQPTSNVVGFDFRHPVTISQRPAGSKNLHWVAVGSAEFEAECRKFIADAGVRPAAPTVTREMVREVWEVLLPGLIAGSYSHVADAFNTFLAEQGGEG